MDDSGPSEPEFDACVRRVLASAKPDVDLSTLSFLAAGEYTYNYRVRLGGDNVVLRIVTGSQMGLDPPEQARYEADALVLLADTGRTPRLIDFDPDGKIKGYPYLLISYLPGHPLNYRDDLVQAARCIAAIHRQETPIYHRLQVHADPVASILDEADQLLQGLSGSPVVPLMDRLSRTPDSTYDAVRGDQTIINTDLNSHNFIVNGGDVSLIDWEKARIGPSIMDIAHFLLPTTTLWRDSTATRLTQRQRETFVSAYLDERPELDPTPYRGALQTAMQLAAVRALAWCAWAVAASQEGARPIVNPETLAKCRLFTGGNFLQRLEFDLWG